MRLNKAQISYFLILGLILVFVIGVGVYFVGNLKGQRAKEAAEKVQEINLEIAPIKNYIQACVHDVATPAVYLLANNGGYIYTYNKTLNTEYAQIAYHLEFDREVSPNKEFMENELSKFVKNSVILCLTQNQNLNAYSLNFGKLNVLSTINNENVLLKINFPVNVQKRDSKISTEDFAELVPIRLGHLINIKDDILNEIKNNTEIDLNYLSQFDSEINVLPYDKSNIIYSIFDNKSSIQESPFYFNFAIMIFENSKPKLQAIPDFVLTKGNQFVTQLNASDPDEDLLTFSSTSNLIEINPITGLVVFMPETLGEYMTEICVSDSYLARDCDVVKFIVENE